MDDGGYPSLSSEACGTALGGLPVQGSQLGCGAALAERACHTDAPLDGVGLVGAGRGRCIGLGLGLGLVGAGRGRCIGLTLCANI